MKQGALWGCSRPESYTAGELKQSEVTASPGARDAGHHKIGEGAEERAGRHQRKMSAVRRFNLRLAQCPKPRKNGSLPSPHPHPRSIHTDLAAAPTAPVTGYHSLALPLLPVLLDLRDKVR